MRKRITMEIVAAMKSINARFDKDTCPTLIMLKRKLRIIGLITLLLAFLARQMCAESSIINGVPDKNINYLDVINVFAIFCILPPVNLKSIMQRTDCSFEYQVDSEKQKTVNEKNLAKRFGTVFLLLSFIALFCNAMEKEIVLYLLDAELFFFGLFLLLKRTERNKKCR